MLQVRARGKKARERKRRGKKEGKKEKEGKEARKRNLLSFNIFTSLPSPISPLSPNLSPQISLISLSLSQTITQSLHRHVGPHRLEHRAVHPRLGPRAPRRQRELDRAVVELLGRLALAECRGDRRRLDDLKHLRARAVPRAHLGVELLDGAVEGGVAVLLVPVFFVCGGGRGSGRGRERKKRVRETKKKSRKFPTSTRSKR